MTIDLTDEFLSPVGTWSNYDNYQASDRDTVRAQKHVDIRSFASDLLIPINVFEMSTKTVGSFTGITVGNINYIGGGFKGVERWTRGSVGPTDPYPQLALNINSTAGTILTAISSMPEAPVDLLTGFADDDIINMAINGTWNSARTTLSACSVSFTDGAIGDFTDGNIATVPFSSSLVSMAGTGNKEFRALRSAFNQNGINLGRITGVRLSFQADGGGNHIFQIRSLRLLAKSWTFQSLDLDTRAGRLRRGVSLNGDAATLPPTWPIMWRADEPSGQNDPRPIDTEMGVIFSTGTQSSTNVFTLYFREVTEDFLTQIDLDSLMMADLDGRDQPDLGNAMYNTRTQSDLEFFDQVQLDTQQQFSLERTPDYLSASWVQFSCQWQSGSAIISVLDTEGNGYTFPLAGGLTQNSLYVFYATLDENAARATIYTIDTAGQVGTKVFDSSILLDDNAYKRRKGRFGWHADFGNGNAYIDSIRTRRTSFAEYRSLPYESVTPVVGAELFVSTSPPIQLFETLAAGPYNSATSVVEDDTQRTLSGTSRRFTGKGLTSMQGVQTNSFLLQDFGNSVINFDLYFPASAGGNFKAFLQDDVGHHTIDLLLPQIYNDQWQNITIELPFDQTEITGRYRLLFLQTLAGEAQWWFDNFKIYTRTVSWDGRGIVDDPWMSNDARWTPFKDNINTDNGGILFPRRGSKLQVRAKGLRHDAHIDRVQFKPKYAELGRFVTKTTQPTISSTLSFTYASNGPSTIRFTGVSTLGSGAYVGNYEWNFGDGASGIGPVVDHTYAASGVYPVTVTMMDNFGNRKTYTSSVAV
jgi:hypothetical protein